MGICTSKNNLYLELKLIVLGLSTSNSVILAPKLGIIARTPNISVSPIIPRSLTELQVPLVQRVPHYTNHTYIGRESLQILPTWRVIGT